MPCENIPSRFLFISDDSTKTSAISVSRRRQTSVKRTFAVLSVYVTLLLNGYATGKSVLVELTSVKKRRGMGMEEFGQKRDNLHIAGVGKAEGGVYAKVQLDGMGTIGGSLDCDDFIGNGSVSVKGALTAKTVRINGSGSVDGPMDALEVNVGGSAKIKADVRARKMSVGGRCHIYGKLIAKEIELSGSLRADNIHTESIEVKGGFNVDGALQANTIEVKLYDRCEAREIYGDYITVCKKGKRIWEQLSFSIRPARLYVRVMEGNRVEVEHTEADIIRGNRIILGPGCKVRLVEYREELIQDPSAEVGEVRLI